MGVTVRSWQLSRGLSFVAAALAGSAATPARAACYPCDAFPPAAWAPERIAADGVLVFQLASETRTEDILPYLTVTVRDAEGAPVDGALELHAAFSTIAWRPAAPWVAGATYTVVTFLDRQQWAEDTLLPVGSFQCLTSEHELEVTIDATPLPPPTAPPIHVEATHRVAARTDLAALVCCDGAYPYLNHQQPGACPAPAVERDGTCRPRLDHGTLELTYSLATDALPPAAAANLVGQLAGGGRRRTLSAPECVRFEVLDVARDVVFVDEQCHGAELAAELGDLETDPSLELAESCEGQPYVCELVGNDRWDPERCTPWPEGAPAAAEDGCGCRSHPGPFDPLAALGLLLALPRRRARGARPSHVLKNMS